MEDTSHTNKKQRVEDGQGEKNVKRKVALLLAYNGVLYQGLQKNPDATTVEETLETAIHRAGGISDENFGTLQKISWSRAGRTDKGVHAVGQIIGLKMLLQPEPMMDRINSELEGTGIRVLGFERVINSFCAHTMCESREYQYVLPVYALRRAAVAVDETGERLGDSAGAEARRREEGLTAEERARLLSYLQQLEGTHYFHNFTDHKLTCKDKQAQRYLLSARVVDVPPLNGTACVSLCYHGQSFLLHQIRKMTSVVVGCMRGDLPPDALGVALSTPSLRSGIPLAPACALTLRRCFFPRYEKWYGERGSIHFERCAAAQVRARWWRVVLRRFSLPLTLSSRPTPPA